MHCSVPKWRQGRDRSNKALIIFHGKNVDLAFVVFSHRK